MRYILIIIIAVTLIITDLAIYRLDQQDKQTNAGFAQLQQEAQQRDDALRAEIDRMKQESSRGGSRRWMEITAYTAGFESTGKHPGHPEYGLTATGYRLTDADAWKVAAADPRYYPPGTRIKVAGVGTVKIVDTGGDIKGPHRLDIFAGMTAVDDADAWGRQQRQVVIER